MKFILPTRNAFHLLKNLLIRLTLFQVGCSDSGKMEGWNQFDTHLTRIGLRIEPIYFKLTKSSPLEISDD